MRTPAEVRLRSCVALQKGKPPAVQPYYGPDAQRYLTPEYLRKGGECELVKAAPRSTHVEDGDAILLWDGSNAGEVLCGRAGILASTMSRASHAGRFDDAYFFYALKQWEPYLKGQTSGSGIPHIDKEIFGNLAITEFDKREQSKIAEVLSTLDRAIKHIEALIAKQQRIKIGLMQDLLTRGIDEHGDIRSEQTHEFKDSGLGRIPVQWELRSLGQCVRADSPICYGILMPGQGVDNGVPVVKVKDIVGGRILQDDLLLTDRRIDRQYRRSRLRSGDLLITIRGTTGRLAVVPPELDGANITQDTARVRLSDDHSVRFCFYCLQSESAQVQIALHTIGQAVMGINIGDVKRLLLALPSPHEQRRLANRFEGLEKTIYETSRVLLKLKSTKAGLMKDLLTGDRGVAALLGSPKELVDA